MQGKVFHIHTAPVFCVCILLMVLASCRKNPPRCASALTLSASDSQPTVGDRLVLYASNGKSIYNWVGPKNFAIQTSDGSDKVVFESIQINQSGWYYCGYSIPGCASLFDSVFIDVKYAEGNPPCALNNNTISGSAVPDLQASSVIKSFDPRWNAMSMYASGNFGHPNYTFIFNSYNGRTEPKDGIYITSNVASFNPMQDANVLFAQCQYGASLFKTVANQQVFISHVDGKLRISFCNLTFGGESGNSIPISATFSGQITEN